LIPLARPEVHRGRFPAVLLDLELDLLTFIERAQSDALDGGDVHEDLSASAYGLNETIALLNHFTVPRVFGGAVGRTVGGVASAAAAA
jgi:hypothetical protein